MKKIESAETTTAIVPVDIRPLICEIRGQQVILDRDLAMLYGVSTKALNQAVKRNAERFPDRFMFRLLESEMDELVTNCDRFGQLKHSSVTMCAFTEQGIAMLSSVLRSAIAVRVSIRIMDAFVAMRKALASMAPMQSRLEAIERRHKSMPVNPLLARAMYMRGYIEHVGSGTGDIIERCRAKGLPPPIWENEDDGCVLTIRRPVAPELVRNGQPDPQLAEHVREHVREHVSEQVERLVSVCKGEMSEKDLRESVGVKNRSNFTVRYLARALEGGYIVRTSSGKRSPTQKYRLTDKGRSLAAQLSKKKGGRK